MTKKLLVGFAIGLALASWFIPTRDWNGWVRWLGALVIFIGAYSFLKRVFLSESVAQQRTLMPQSMVDRKTILLYWVGIIALAAAFWVVVRRM